MNTADFGALCPSVQDQLARARRSRARYETLLRKGFASPIEVQDARDKEAALMHQALEDRCGTAVEASHD